MQRFLLRAEELIDGNYQYMLKDRCLDGKLLYL